MDLAPNYHTFARRFAQHAYHTVCSGKLHHLGPDQMQGWTQRLAPDAHVYDKFSDGLISEEMKKYSVQTMARRTNEQYVKEACCEPGRYQRFDDKAAEEAEYFIRSYFQGGGDKRPLLLKTSFLQPHYPFQTDKERFDYYHERVPIYSDEPCGHPVLSMSQIEQPVNVTDDEIRRATATYYGMIDAIDTHYGRILHALESSGQDLDDWIIIYLSDHGEMLGEHGIWEKARFYEASVRVPLIIRWPKHFSGGKIVNENVNLCDLFATLCDMAGLPVQPNLDSRSLVPLMEGHATNWSNETVSHIKRHHRNHVMIKQGYLKYQYYGEDIPEILFDLEQDPGEITDFSTKPAYSEHMSKFRTRLANLGYGPNADLDYVNAGYEPGIPVNEAGTGTLWPPDSNPWLEPLKNHYSGG